MKVRLRGPLYGGSPVSEVTVRMGFSEREKTLERPAPTTINPPYADLLPYQCIAMSLDEMAAEKIRAVMTRSSARDLYDLAFLVRMKTALDRALVMEKMRYYGLSFDRSAFEKRVRSLKPLWKTEIAALTRAPVEFEFAATTVLEKIKK